MSSSTLLLNRLIPRKGIELGRLIIDPQYPDQDFFQPPLTLAAEGSSSASVHQVEDFQLVLNRANGTRIHAKLLSLLTFGPISHSRISSTTIKAQTCVTRLLEKPQDFLKDICGDKATRAWLETEFRKQSGVSMQNGWCGRSVYLVCGFKSLTDAQITQSRGRQNEMDISVSAPLPIAPVSLTGQDIEVGGGFTKASNVNRNFTAPGEHVFAVQYRKLRCSWFSSRDVDTAYLEDRTRWKVFIDTRGSGGDDRQEDCLKVEIDEPLGARDMRGPYSKVDLDQDEVFYWEEDESDEDI